MSRYTRLHPFILGLLLASLFLFPASTSAKPKEPLPCPPQEQKDGRCEGPVFLDDTVITATYLASLQTGSWTCTVSGNVPWKGVVKQIFGRGVVTCSETVTISMRVCVQVGRWYGWQTLGCIDETVQSTSIDRTIEVTGLSGTYTYRTYVYAWVSGSGGSDQGGGTTPGGRYTLP